MSLSRKTTLILGLLVLAWAFAPEVAHATSVGGAMPWDSSLLKVSQSFTGPFAYAMTILGLVSAGVVLLFVQEIPYFIKAIAFVVLVGSLLMGANAFASTMGWAGAVV